MTHPLRRAGDNAAPIPAGAQLISDALIPWIQGYGPIPETDRREVAHGLLLRALLAMPSHGSPQERLNAVLRAPGASPMIRAVVLEAFCSGAIADPLAPWEEVARLVDLLAPAT